MENFLLKGLLVGLVFGVPAGAIGALTIQRTLSHGFWAGLLTGLGSSAADVLYACVGVFGLTAISDALLRWQTPI
ncbi:MAG: LysE family translocator, partial [Oscillospiraceae bacterium]|nr:LysE family translocator [Oscillospiraceae bacterium]